MPITRRLTLVAAALVLAGAAAPSFAQGAPDLKITAPAGAGGGWDSVALAGGGLALLTLAWCALTVRRVHQPAAAH